MMIRGLLCAVALSMGLTPPETNPASDPARAFLMSSFHVSSADLSQIDARQVVARTLPAIDPREVATLGIVRIEVTPEAYVERLSDIVRFKQTDGILQIGRFSDPATSNDVAELTLDDGDVRRLRECRVGDCGVQLPADAIERFQRNVDWRRADLRSQVSRVMQQILVDYVTQYRQRGSEAVVEYADRAESFDVGRAFASLVNADENTWLLFADLRRHLLEYPNSGASGTTDIVYWSKERVARRGVVSVTHLAISHTPQGPADYAIASKQIYAAHYFDASLGLTLLLPARATPTPAMYLVYLNRSRIDIFDGMLGGIARKMVSNRARALVSEQLERLQRSLEGQPSHRQPGG